MRMTLTITAAALTSAAAFASPTAKDHLVVSASQIASDVGAAVMADGGNAVEAAVATAFALAVTVPRAGNIGGGGFLLYQPADGEPIAYDFREKAPGGATEDMWLVNGKYDPVRHHDSHLAVGVPGTVAGLYMAWTDNGSLPWERLVSPAIELAERGFTVGPGLAASLESAMPRLERYEASLEQFTRRGELLAEGETLRQPELARTLERIAVLGPAGFYGGETAALSVAEMGRGGGIITLADLQDYEAVRREPIVGEYRDHTVIGFPPPSSGGVVTVQALNTLEGFDLEGYGFGSARTLHLFAETMRRAYADRALHLGDPDFNSGMPIARLTSKRYGERKRARINPAAADVSSPDTFRWPAESFETTHLSVVDGDRNAVALTYTLEQSYGSAITVPGAGFLLNNEMGDFNPKPGMTTARGHIGTPPNLTAPGKRMLSSMSPTIVLKDGEVYIVTGSPGGRTIITTVVQTIVNIIDFGMSAQEATDAPRAHHQWLPDELRLEAEGFGGGARMALEALGHSVRVLEPWGAAQIIVVDTETGGLEAGVDPRRPDAGASGE